MQEGNCTVKQPDYPISIARTQTCAIHGIHFGLHMIFNRFNYIYCKLDFSLSKIRSMDWTTSNSNLDIRQILFQDLLTEVHFWLGDVRWIEGDSPIFRWLYHRDTSKYIQFLVAHLPFQVQHQFAVVHRAACKSRWLHTEMNLGDWWWDMQDQLLARVITMTVICVSDKYHLNNLSGD